MLMKIIIVGGGETGTTLTKLLGKDAEVTIIEKEKEIANNLSSKADALVINGDGTDISILKEAEFSKADALVATTNDDKTNLMICQIAKSEKIKKIIPIVHAPKNEELFTKLGITSLVSVAGTNASGIKRMLQTFGDARIVTQLGGGDVQIIQQVISKNSMLIDKPAVIKNAVIATVYRKGDLIIPTVKTILKEGDVVLVAVKTKNMSSIAELIKGE